jgi:hypothetical protein
VTRTPPRAPSIGLCALGLLVPLALLGNRFVLGGAATVIPITLAAFVLRAPPEGATGTLRPVRISLGGLCLFAALPA